MGNKLKLKIIIYVEISLFILELICFLLGILFAAALENFIQEKENYVEANDQNRSEMVSTLRAQFVMILAITAVSLLTGLILLILLHKGYAQRSAEKLKVWFYVMGVFTGLAVLCVVASAIGKNPTMSQCQIILIVGIVYRVWTLVVVKGFINEIQDGAQSTFQGAVCEKA